MSKDKKIITGFIPVIENKQSFLFSVMNAMHLMPKFEQSTSKREEIFCVKKALTPNQE